MKNFKNHSKIFRFFKTLDLQIWTKMEKYLPVFSNSETPAKKTTNISSQNPVIVKISPVQVNPEEVTDEFAPDASEDSIENVTESEPVKMETFSICDNNHWVHLFSDTDVNVECILTEQVCDMGNLRVLNFDLLSSKYSGCRKLVSSYYMSTNEN